MGMRFFDTVGKRIRVLREDLGMNQKMLCSELEKQDVYIGQSYISRIENTEKIPSGEVLVGLAQVLHTTTDYLLLLTDDPSTPSESEESSLYIDADIADRTLLQRLIDVFSALTQADQQFIIEMADRLHATTQPRIIGEEEETEKA